MALGARRLAHLAQAARKLQAGLLIFGLFSFWLSLSPDWPWQGSGPAYWLHTLVSQIRVPSRAGIYVHFAALLLAGLFVHFRRLKWLALPGLLPLLMIVDLPPFWQPMPISPVRPPLQALMGKECGAGLYFPYVAGDAGMLQDYYFLQEMRGSKCGI
ncbi:MAG: hypothetical protein HC883_01265 [Bdellovibrionaceae bacterium]|nr:hypothetical protein [Pseudobdellovibrionaceae bacterium]